MRFNELATLKAKDLNIIAVHTNAEEPCFHNLRMHKTLAQIAEKIQQRNEAIELFIADHGEVCFQAPCGRRDDQYLIVHRSTHPGYESKWQASFFDDEGASGHMIRPYKQLLKDLMTFCKLDLDRITQIEKPLRQ